MPEISRNDLAALNAELPPPELDTEREVPVWEHPDAPAGSTPESLLVYERGKPVRVSGPTHYTHLADGRVVSSFGIGTHHTEADPSGGPDRVTLITSHYGG